MVFFSYLEACFLNIFFARRPALMFVLCFAVFKFFKVFLIKKLLKRTKIEDGSKCSKMQNCALSDSEKNMLKMQFIHCHTEEKLFF
jgi:hypothetical protein